MEAVGDQVEIEVFVLNDGCAFEEGFCATTHHHSVGAFCTVALRDARRDFEWNGPLFTDAAREMAAPESDGLSRLGLVCERQWLWRDSQGSSLRSVRIVRHSRPGAHRRRVAEDRGPRSFAVQETGQRANGAGYRRPRARRVAQAARDRARDLRCAASREHCDSGYMCYYKVDSELHSTGRIPLAGYRRALGSSSRTGRGWRWSCGRASRRPRFGLVQPYISKLLIDDALLRRNLHMLLIVSGLMVGVTVLGFALNILSSYQYVRVSATVLFDMRLALYRHLQTLSPRFWARTQAGRRGFAHQQRHRGGAARLGGQLAERALERGVSGRQRGHHGVAESRGCFW